MTQPNQTADQLLQSVMNTIDQSRKELSKGVLLDLTTMEKEVMQLCEVVTELEPDSRNQYAGPMESLYQQLTDLGTDLTNVRDYLKTQMNELPNHQRANIAYKSADAVDNFGAANKDDEQE